MALLHGLLSGTPVWVWVLMAYGFFMGIRAFRQREVFLPLMAIMPALFLFLSVPSLVAIIADVPMIGLAWFFSMVAGILLGWFFLAPDPLSIDKSHIRIVVPGTWSSLVLFVTIFAIKYVYNVVRAINPVLAAQPGFLLAVFGLSGVSTGIVIGRTAKYFGAYLGHEATVTE